VQVLSDGETRQRYDQFGEAGLRGSGMGGGGGGAGGYEVDLGIYVHIQYIQYIRIVHTTHYTIV
jgi:DnaJ-class molecular chaperone